MVIIITSLISLIFAFLFFFLKGKKNSSGTLSVFYFIWSVVFLCLFVATEEKIVRFNETTVNAFALLFFPFFIALPPLVYIYTSEYLKSKLNEILPHLYISISVLLINLFSFLYFNFSEDNTSFLYEVCENVMTYTNYLVVLFIFPISNVFYLVKSFKLVSKVRKDNNKVDFFNFKWITFFVWSYLLLILFLFVAQSKIFSNVFQITFVWFIGLYFTILAFYGYKTEKNSIHNLEDVNLDNELDILEAIDERLKVLIENNKVFLDPDLTIKKLARHANTNEKYLSNLLNNKYNKNFATFINYYRIEYAKIVLLDNEYSNYTIESLAFLVGFNSKSVFNATFKKATNITPSVYKLNKKGAN